MRSASCFMIALCVSGSALVLAACEAPMAKKGGFSASIQQFSLPPSFAKLFTREHSKGKKTASRGSRAAAKKTTDKPVGKAPAIVATKAVELEADEVRRMLTGNSLYAGGGGLEFAAIHKPDGAMAGRAWSAEGISQGNGIWRVEADGTYCRKWDNEWADGEWGCFKVMRVDAKLNLQRISGAGTDGDMTLVPGNAYGL